MNRTIKFRAKRSDDNRWVYGHYFQAPLTIENFGSGYLTTPNQKKLDCIESDGIVFSIKRETLGQFTGLTDKNNKEIYENDILDQVLDNKPCYYIVEYANLSQYCGFGLKALSKRDGSFRITIYDFKTYLSEGFEKIGNIYDNPELLKP